MKFDFESSRVGMKFDFESSRVGMKFDFEISSVDSISGSKINQ